MLHCMTEGMPPAYESVQIHIQQWVCLVPSESTMEAGFASQLAIHSHGSRVLYEVAATKQLPPVMARAKATASIPIPLCRQQQCGPT